MEESLNPNILIVIPARGGSKGVPRKNLRPLCGQPLIAYSVKAALASRKASRVVVSTDDDEIAMFASRYGAEVVRRPEELSTDKVPLDPVIIHAAGECEKKFGEKYGLVLTVQPTSPLVRGADIDGAIDVLGMDGVDTVISAIDDRHLRWVVRDGGCVPEYSARVNRQQLPPAYKETGAVIGCKRHVLATGTRIGASVQLYVVPHERSVDIDSYNDFAFCEFVLKKKRIVMAVIGNPEIGMGHVYRAALIAGEMINHEVIFLCSEEDPLAIKSISSHNYRVETYSGGDRLKAILDLAPDMVINDILDTSSDYVVALKKSGITVVNFEDMGLGAEVADLVINALYPHQLPRANILVGPRYFCLRDEFLCLPGERTFNREVRRILLMFGGVDENNLTCRVLELIAPELENREIGIDVILGPGYLHHEKLEALKRRLGSPSLNIVVNTPQVSEYMYKADLAITSAGRTVLEMASLAVPMIVISQNTREMTHSFASSENGVINLGIWRDVSDDDIVRTVERVIEDAALRDDMVTRLRKVSFRDGKKTVIKLINGLLDRTMETIGR